MPHSLHDLGQGDFPPFARQAVTATQAAYAVKNPSADQLLQHRFEIAAGNSLPAIDLAALHGLCTGIIGDIEDGLDGKHQFFR